MRWKSNIVVIAFGVATSEIKTCTAFTSSSINSPCRNLHSVIENTCLMAVNDDEEEEEAKTKRGMVRSIFQGSGDKKSKNADVVDGDSSPDSDGDDVGFFRGLTRRLPGRRNDTPEPVSKKESELARLDEPLNLVEGVFETMAEMRKRLNAVRTAEMLEDTVRSGILLEPDEEVKRLNEIREQLLLNRRMQDQLQKARKELAAESQKSREENRKAALMVAKERVEEKISKAKEQRKVYERQRQLVRVASGKAPKGSLRTPSSAETSNRLPSFSWKGENETAASIEQAKREANKNIQSAPQRMFSRSGSNSTIEDEPEPKSSFSPVSGAQRLASSLWDSTFGSGKGEEWVVAFPKSRIDPGEAVPVNVAGIDLLVVASRDGKKIYCIANSCSHLGTPLETGMMERRKRKDANGAAASGDDGCEDCVVCPLHQTAFALETGEVNGEWCPYPPVLGKMMGATKSKSSVAVFDIRTKGKNIEIKINSQVDVMDGLVQQEAKTEKKKES